MLAFDSRSRFNDNSIDSGQCRFESDRLKDISGRKAAINALVFISTTDLCKKNVLAGALRVFDTFLMETTFCAARQENASFSVSNRSKWAVVNSS